MSIVAGQAFESGDLLSKLHFLEYHSDSSVLLMICKLTSVSLSLKIIFL